MQPYAGPASEGGCQEKPGFLMGAGIPYFLSIKKWRCDSRLSETAMAAAEARGRCMSSSQALCPVGKQLRGTSRGLGAAGVKPLLV